MLSTMFVDVGRWGRTVVAQVQGKSSKSSFTLDLKRNASENDISFAWANGFELLTRSYNEAVYRSDIDAVILALPHNLHAEQTMIAARAGKHIACEKPFTLNRKDALASIESARKANETPVVPHNRRFCLVSKLCTIFLRQKDLACFAMLKLISRQIQIYVIRAGLLPGGIKIRNSTWVND